MSRNNVLRIVYLVSQYPTVSHTYILREVQALRGQGVDVETVSIASPDRPFGALTPEEQGETARTFYVKQAGVGHALVAHARTLLSSPLRYLAGLLGATRLAGWNPRVVLAHWFYFGEAVVVGQWMRANGHTHLHTHFSSNVALSVGRVFDLAVSATIHGSGEFREPNAFHLSEKVAELSFVRAISNYGRSQMMLVSPVALWEKIEVVPLGVDPDLYAPRPFVQTPVPFRILSVGLLSAVKGFPILIDALARLSAGGRHVYLELIGDGPDREELVRLVAEKGLSGVVEFSGWRTQEQVRDAYRRADLFALASFAEGIPVVLIEAMAMEVPCVATRITGIPELIEDGVSGLLVTPADVSALADAIARLMGDEAMRRRMGAAGRLKIEREYSLAMNTSRLHDLFDRRVLGAP